MKTKEVYVIHLTLDAENAHRFLKLLKEAYPELIAKIEGPYTIETNV